MTTADLTNCPLALIAAALCGNPNLPTDAPALESRLAALDDSATASAKLEEALLMFFYGPMQETAIRHGSSAYPTRLGYAIECKLADMIAATGASDVDAGACCDALVLRPVWDQWIASGSRRFCPSI